MRAIAKAASAPNAVAMITEPKLRIALFASQRKNSPPRSASLKFAPSSGHGNPYVFSRYWSFDLNAVEIMNQTG